jgi:hypothetical protein
MLGRIKDFAFQFGVRCGTRRVDDILVKIVEMPGILLGESKSLLLLALLMYTA